MSLAHFTLPDNVVEADDRRAAIDAAVQRALGEHSHRASLDVPEVAGVLGVSRATAYELVRTGVIPSIRAGRRVIVPLPAFVALLLGVEMDGGP